ncbi:hypothetical protein ACE193_25260 [Bernardetia sp. OM2101]|uniref:hypothetical protein n=1 Tax=Bernardetia sp. OM2101 TaxID=3344876 RepID=UPI0035D1121A
MLISTKRTILLLLFVLIPLFSFGQFVEEYKSKILAQDHVIQDYERWLRDGNKYGLFQLAGYLDDTTRVTEYLGYHVLQSTISEIVRRDLEENTSFLDNEFEFTDSTTQKQFEDFIYSNREQIHFSELSETFLITPFDEREIEYRLETITQNQVQDLEDKQTILLEGSSLEQSWIKEYNIDELIKKKDPKALLRIAQHLFHIRSRFNEYYHYFEGHQELLKLLTHKNLFVKDRQGKYTHNFEQNTDKEKLTNLLTFFAKYYQNFQWNEEESFFECKNLKVEVTAPERYLFDLIYQHDNDSLALSAFQKIITSDSVELILKLNNEYGNKIFTDRNSSLPNNLDSFIPTLLTFSQYCKNNEIEFLPSQKVTNYINHITDTLILYNDYEKIDSLEEILLKNIHLDEITALEFWFFSERSYTSFQVGRFLDKFYSQKWDSLLHSPKHLKLYLKKMSWFETTQIIAYYYITKFYSDDKEIQKLLENLDTQRDKEIEKQIEKIKKMNSTYKKPSLSINEITYDSTLRVKPIDNFEERFKKIVRTEKEDEIQNGYILDTLLNKISYSQISKALDLLNTVKYRYEFSKYDFINESFGLGIESFSWDSLVRQDFMKIYDSLTRYELCEYYLAKNNIDYKIKGTDSLDYDKIYQLFKYGIAYSISASEEPDSYLYFIIKILEMKFGTTLGYSENLQASGEYYITQIKRRKNKWKLFLEQNNLIKDNTPPSFTYYITIMEN